MKLGKVFVYFLCVLCFLAIATASEAARKYHFGYHKELEVRITPDSPEFVAGSLATFTISLTNKSKITQTINYPSGQQWDLGIYHGNKMIFRWSNGCTWENRAFSLSLRPGESISEKLTWVSVNKFGSPLVQGKYKCVGIVCSQPKSMVSDEVEFRLTPPSVVAKESITTKQFQPFTIELPRYTPKTELEWIIKYKYNDNRIDAVSRKITEKSVILTFIPKRVGHVEFDLYAYPIALNSSFCLERRSYRIEVE